MLWACGVDAVASFHPSKVAGITLLESRAYVGVCGFERIFDAATEALRLTDFIATFLLSQRSHDGIPLQELARLQHELGHFGGVEGSNGIHTASPQHLKEGKLEAISKATSGRKRADETWKALREFLKVESGDSA